MQRAAICSGPSEQMAALSSPSLPAAFELSPLPPTGGTADSIPVARVSRKSEFVKLEKKGVTPHFWNEQIAYAESICAKLRSIGEDDLAYGLSRCGAEETIQVCARCESRTFFKNHCDKLYCPLCQPRLAARRRTDIEFWAGRIKQPKHVVLTTRNTDALSRTQIARFKRAFNGLRRSKFARNWAGGTFALEVTNESKGWHLHSHSLIDARFIDARGLATKWAKQTGQDFAIVKVKDARSKDYLAEVTKYAVKGSMLASWQPQQIAEFIRAFSRTRTWACFGSLWQELRAWRHALLEVDKPPRACECGCSNLLYLTPNRAAERDLQPIRHHATHVAATRQRELLRPPTNYETRA
jgi:ribosomal protein S27AE